MTKKFTYQEVSDFYRSHDCVLLEDEYIGNSKKMKFICKCGNKDIKTLAQFKKTKTCRECNYKRNRESQAFSIENVKIMISDKGSKLISDQYVNNSTPIIIECPNKHEYTTTFQSFQMSKGCPYCAGNAKYTYEQVFKEFESRGYTLLDKEYKSANKNLKYSCVCGNVDEVSLSKLKKRRTKCVHKEYTEEFLVSEFWRFLDEHKIYPRSTDFKTQTGYPPISAYYKLFGTYNNFLTNCVGVLGENGWYKCDEEILIKFYADHHQEFILENLMIKRNWEAVINKARLMNLKRYVHSNGKVFFNKDSLIDCFWDFYKEFGKFPLCKDYVDNEKYPSASTIQRYFDSWEDYLKEVGVVDRSNTDGWYIHDEALIRRYYPINQIELIENNLMIKRTQGSIRMKASDMGIRVKNEYRYIPKYKKEEVINAVVQEAQDFFKKNGRSPYRNELSFARNATEQNWDSYNDFLVYCGLPILRRDPLLKTREDGINFLINLRNLLGRNPFVTELDNYGVSKSWFTLKFGSYRTALYAAKLIKEEDINEQLKIDNSIDSFKELYATLNRVPTVSEAKEWASKHNYYSPQVLASKVTENNSYAELCRMIFGESNRLEYDKNELIGYLFELKEKLGRTPMAKDLEENGYPSREVYRYFFNVRYFNDIIRDIGWEPFGHDPIYKTDEELLDDYVELFKKLGRIPLRDDINDESTMCHSSTYISRFESIANICELLELNYNELIADSKMGSGTSCFDNSGDICRSIPEMVITNILIDMGVKYVKEYPYEKVTDNMEDRRRFDWYLPEFDIYVEYFGLYDSNRIDSTCRNGVYSRKVLKKIKDCKTFNKCLIELYPADKKNNFKSLINILNRTVSKSVS